LSTVLSAIFQGVLLDGETPYSWAIWYGKDEAAKLLAHKKAANFILRI